MMLPTGGQRQQTGGQRLPTGTPQPLQPIQQQYVQIESQRLPTGGQRLPTGGQRLPTGTPQPLQPNQEQQYAQLQTGGQRLTSGTPQPLHQEQYVQPIQSSQRQQTGTQFVQPLQTGGQRQQTGTTNGDQFVRYGSSSDSQGQLQRLPTRGNVEEIQRSPLTGQLQRSSGQLSRPSRGAETTAYRRRSRYTEYTDANGNRVKCYESETLGYICEE